MECRSLDFRMLTTFLIMESINSASYHIETLLGCVFILLDFKVTKFVSCSALFSKVFPSLGIAMECPTYQDVEVYSLLQHL